jgi:hypothetical protein
MAWAKREENLQMARFLQKYKTRVCQNQRATRAYGCHKTCVTNKTQHRAYYCQTMRKPLGAYDNAKTAMHNNNVRKQNN